MSNSVNKYWGSQQCPKSDEPMRKCKKPTESVQGKCRWTFKKPFKYIRALRQTSKLMMCLQRDVYLPGEQGKWGVSQSGSFCMWFWGKGLGGRKAGCTNLKFWQSSWQVKSKNLKYKLNTCSCLPGTHPFPSFFFKNTPATCKSCCWHIEVYHILSSRAWPVIHKWPIKTSNLVGWSINMWPKSR